MKLIIGNKNYSSWSMRPWLLLSAHGLPFEEARIPLFKENTQEMLTQYTVAGKVPVLHDGDLIVWDSLAICEYLSERYLDGKGWPSDVNARAEARSATAEMHSGFAQIRSKLPMNCRAVNRRVEIDPALAKEIQRVDGLWSELRKKYSDRGPWLFGEFSIADCFFAPVASRFRSYGVGLSRLSSDYLETVFADEHVERWHQESSEEPEVIQEAEVGR